MARPATKTRTNDDVYYQAMLARDARFDGKFFVGVRTTGIYCRPICPAKPKRENVEFFGNYLAAERAGYRPCLRCRPESAPRSPAWIGKTAIVQRAIKMLQDQTTLELNEEEFAARFGVTARHLRRLFVEDIGKTPKQLSFDRRLNLSRKLIAESNLSVAEIAFAAGFNSIRRFNDAFKLRFSRTPIEIRRSLLRASSPRESNLVLSLAYRPPYDFTGLLWFYRAHQVGDLEWFEGETMHRIFELADEVGQFSVTNDPKHSRILVEIDFPETSLLHVLLPRVRTMFDLDSDPLIIANSLESDRRCKSVLAKHPGIRLPSGWDPFEISISTILGQLVSMGHGRALVKDLIEMLGRESGIQRGGRPVKFFPTPEVLANADLSALKTTAVRRRTLQSFSRAVADGELSLEPTQDIEAFTKKALAIPGIGPWTATYIAMKALRHTDAFPATDLILARALELHPLATLEKMRPWRGYAAALFWREYAETLTKKKGAKK